MTYQIKIPITAILCVCMLKKKISRCQWFSLLLLTVGVAFLHLEGGANAMRRSHDNATIIHQSTLQSHSSLQSHKAFLHVANKVNIAFAGGILGTCVLCKIFLFKKIKRGEFHDLTHAWGREFVEGIKMKKFWNLFRLYCWNHQLKTKIRTID